MKDRAPEGVIEAPEGEDVVVADYVVHGPAGSVTITAIADLVVGERGELVLTAGEAGDLAGAVAAAVAAGVEINALPILTPMEPGIADWFREHVAGPAGGFVIEATPEAFGRAIRAKLALEVAAR